MAKIYDVHNNVLVHQFLAPVARTASATSAVLDTLASGKKIGGRAALVMSIGAFTTGTSALQLQESSATPTGGFTNVTAAVIAAKGATGIWSVAVDLEPLKRYLRVVNTGASTPVYTNAVYLIAAAKDNAPVTNPTA